MAVDEAKLNEFLGKAVGDLGAAMSATLILVGDRLGLYRELAKGAMTSAELAQRTGTDERYVREWLGNQGAGGYVDYDSASDEWSLSPEQALCLTDPNGPVDMPGAYNIVEATFHALEHTLDNFKSGAGMEWGEHHPCLFEGTERFFRAGYNTNLIDSWLPALDGVVDKLQRGAKVADVGCGHGASTILMALDVSGFGVRRLRLSRRIDHRRNRKGSGGGCGAMRDSRSPMRSATKARTST